MYMKEMKYTNNAHFEMIAQGEYKNYNYYVFNMGTHPTAYVEVPKGHKYYGLQYNDIDIDVHGCLTYSQYHLPRQNNGDTWVIGWDYAHFGDYMPIPGDVIGIDTHIWTTEEIVRECKSVIEQLVEANNE